MDRRADRHYELNVRPLEERVETHFNLNECDLDIDDVLATLLDKDGPNNIFYQVGFASRACERIVEQRQEQIPRAFLVNMNLLWNVTRVFPDFLFGHMMYMDALGYIWNRIHPEKKEEELRYTLENAPADAGLYWTLVDRCEGNPNLEAVLQDIKEVATEEFPEIFSSLRKNPLLVHEGKNKGDGIPKPQLRLVGPDTAD